MLLSIFGCIPLENSAKNSVSEPFWHLTNCESTKDAVKKIPSGNFARYQCPRFISDLDPGDMVISAHPKSLAGWLSMVRLLPLQELELAQLVWVFWETVNDLETHPGLSWPGNASPQKIIRRWLGGGRNIIMGILT